MLLLTFFLVDLLHRVQIDSCDDHIRKDVGSSDKVQHLRIFEWDLLGDLHHHKDDHKVGTGKKSVMLHK